ncbi:MAG: MFS transporter [Oligoflexales bacterium]|nr:MFS transporter [Oligoflexales bacterium]
MANHLSLFDQEKHPRGMYVLAFTELFERFSYYTLSFLLVLFASDQVAHGGLGWSKENALTLSSVYTCSAFVLPILGGFLADKWLGIYPSAITGALLIITGHVLMFFANAEHLNYLFSALFLVALGTAFFKPCLPSMLGQLYSPESKHREAGFSYYYMGINLGAMFAGIISGLLLQRFGYQIALSSAAVGMIVGLTVFVLGKRHLRPHSDEYMAAAKNNARLSPIASSPQQSKALSYLCLSYLFVAIWALVYNLALSGTLTLYIENFTKKTVYGYNIPSTFFQSLESIGIILTAPALIFFYRLLGEKRSPHFFSQMNIAVLLSTLALSLLTFMSYQVADVNLNTTVGYTPFAWYQMTILILIVSVSEVMISPVMMSAISLLSPEKSKTMFQSFFLFVIGVMGLIAGKIGAISLSNPFQTFLLVTISAAVIATLYTLVRKSMVEAASIAAQEKDLQTSR